MENKTFSIFNDVLGPVLTGPSSSHAAGPSKIGYIARHLIDSEPESVVFEFDRNGSFAASYYAQGTDRGLVGGILGYKADDTRLLTALSDADKCGLKYEFRITDFEADHPNTVRISIAGRGEDFASMTGKSVGGGIIEITEIDGCKVSIDGKSVEILIYYDDIGDETITNEILSLLPDGCEEVELLKCDEKLILELKLSYMPSEDILERLKAKCHVKVIPAVFPLLFVKNCEVPYRSSKEMEEWAGDSYSPGEAGMFYEMEKGNLNRDTAMSKMYSLIDVMEDSVKKGLSGKRPGKLIKACSSDYIKAKEEKKLIDCGAMDTAIAWSMAMVERNSCYGTVVAAPTSGACGTVPGAVLGVCDFIGATKEEKAMAMFATGAIGIIIAEKATFAAEICGCQAECGSASAMAAAGIVQLLGGSVHQALEAASIALQNVLGMICDSVANLVEVPCLGRNVLGAVNAISAANMVMAGEEAVIPFDEVCESMIAVGKLMPPELCCTNSGGLAITDTSLRLAKEIEETSKTQS